MQTQVPLFSTIVQSPPSLDSMAQKFPFIPSFSLQFFHGSHSLNSMQFQLATKPFIGWSPSLTTSWADPGSNMNKLPTKPSKTIGPPGKPEGNTTHRVYCAVSLDIFLWLTTMLRCLQSRKEWGSGIATHLLRPWSGCSFFFVSILKICSSVTSIHAF